MPNPCEIRDVSTATEAIKKTGNELDVQAEK